MPKLPEVTANVDGQFVELSNVSERAVDLSGMVLTTLVGTVTLPATVLAAGESAVICVDTDPAQNGGIFTGAASRRAFVRRGSAHPATLDRAGDIPSGERARSVL